MAHDTVSDFSAKSFTNQQEIYFNGDPLLVSPIPVFFIILGYLIFTKKLGPCLMKDRPPFNLDKVLIVYNAVQVAWSCYICYLGYLMISTFGFFDKTCRSTHDPIGNGLFHAGYCYFLAKISELLDTVFFVLRKKQNQVTFLHVYHHSLMVICGWLCFKYEASYSLMFLGTLNTFVHVIMYTYYGLSAIPAMKPYLWWKKYITKIQLIQFSMILIHMMILVATSKCPPSNMLLGIVLWNASFFIYLFSKFYFNAYMEGKARHSALNKIPCFNDTEEENIKQS